MLDAGLSLRVRAALPPGTGAKFLAIHNPSHTAFVSGSLSRALLSFQYDPVDATITQPVAVAETSVNGPLALHPARRILYMAAERGIDVYEFQEDGKIRCIQHLDINVGALQLQSLQYSPQFDALFLSTPTGLLRLSANPVSGLLENPELVSTVPQAQSVVIL
jgi:6-phosphogluconolactonase (cycloisomerase 2 family)